MEKFVSLLRSPLQDIPCLLSHRAAGAATDSG